VGNLDWFSIRDGSSKIMNITPEGSLTTVDINFTILVGLAYDAKGQLHALENTIGNPFPTPGTGQVVRIDGRHSTTVIATGCRCPRQ
jgi:hypothetical protein